MMLEPNDSRLTAYALGELDDTERVAVEAELEESPAARQTVEELREIAAQLSRELTKEPLTTLSQLQRIAIEDEVQHSHRRVSRFPWIGMAVAASLVAAIGLYMVLHRPAEKQLANTDNSPKRVEPGQPKNHREETPHERVAKNLPASRESSGESIEGTGSPNSAEMLAIESPAGPVTDVETTVPTPQPETDADSAASNAVAKMEPNKAQLKKVDDASWIDQRVANNWQDNGIKPSAVASDGEFIRRAYLDIVGAIPSIEVAAEYIKSRDKEKKAKLVTSLVNSEEYTKYWAGIWSNLLIGRQPGRNIDKRSLQKYLRDSFAENKPWSKMVFELVTATGGSTPKSLQAGVPFNGATNFLLAHMNDRNVPATAFTTRLFLGVQVQCTQCHDHPFNDRTQEAFWGVNAFFQKMRSIEHDDPDDTGRRRFVFAELNDDRSRSDLFVRFDKRNGLVSVTPPRLLDGRIIDPGEKEINLREELARYIVDVQNEYFGQAIVNRMWAHFMGRGVVHPLDDLGTHNPASNPDLLTRLADNFRESNYDLKRLIAWIALSQPYGLSSETNSTNKEDDQYFSHYPLKQMSPEQFFDSLMVASKANRVGSKGWEQAEKMKDDLQGQFTAVFNNDENGEADSFNGTIPQALLLMNGNIIQKAISKEKGSYLAERVDDIVKKKVRGADVALLNDLYLAAVSRYPTQKEKVLAGQLLQDTMAKSKDKNPMEAYQDIFWALLNSSEFVLNH